MEFGFNLSVKLPVDRQQLHLDQTLPRQKETAVGYTLQQDCTMIINVN